MIKPFILNKISVRPRLFYTTKYLKKFALSDASSAVRRLDAPTTTSISLRNVSKTIRSKLKLLLIFTTSLVKLERSTDLVIFVKFMKKRAKHFCHRFHSWLDPKPLERLPSVPHSVLRPTWRALTITSSLLRMILRTRMMRLRFLPWPSISQERLVLVFWSKISQRLCSRPSSSSRIVLPHQGYSH